MATGNVATVLTPPGAGAIAVVRIAGPEADAADTETTGPGVMYVVREFLAQHDRLTDQGKELFRRYPDPESWTTLTDWLDQVRAGHHGRGKRR